MVRQSGERISSPQWHWRLYHWGRVVSWLLSVADIERDHRRSKLILQNDDAKKMDFRTFCAQHAIVYQQQIVRNDAEASIDKAAHYAELWNHTGSAEAEEPAMKRKRLTSTSTAFQRKWTAQQLHRFDYLAQLSLHEPGKPFNLQTEQDLSLIHI